MDSSPIHVHLLKRGSRQILLSSEDEQGSRAPEVQDSTAEPVFSEQDSGSKSPDTSMAPKSDTHCASSPQGSVHYGSNLGKPASLEENAEQGTIIEFTYRSHSPWESDMESETSTPDFKRGKHRQEELEQAAVKEILEKGVHWPVPSWIRRRQVRGPSVLILADAQFKHWPAQLDKVCQIEFHPNWPIKWWTQAIRLGQLKITCHTVVIYLEGLCHWADIPPIKNALTSLCKAVRNHGVEPRIFVSNILPQVGTSPLKSVNQFNFTLQLAVRSTCRVVGSVHELSLYEHFMSAKNRRLRPTHKYFEVGGLSRLGCLIARECILRKAGVKSYWFEERGVSERK